MMIKEMTTNDKTNERKESNDDLIDGNNNCSDASSVACLDV